MFFRHIKVSTSNQSYVFSVKYDKSVANQTVAFSLAQVIFVVGVVINSFTNL